MDTETATHREKTPCEDEGGGRSDASTGQRTPKAAGEPAGARGEARNGLSSLSREGTHIADVSTLDSQPPELCHGKFLTVTQFCCFAASALANWHSNPVLCPRSTLSLIISMSLGLFFTTSQPLLEKGLYLSLLHPQCLT